MKKRFRDKISLKHHETNFKAAVEITGRYNFGFPVLLGTFVEGPSPSIIITNVEAHTFLSSPDTPP